MTKLYLGSASKSAYWSEIKVLYSFRQNKSNSRRFPNIMEVSVDFGQKQISLSDIVTVR